MASFATAVYTLGFARVRLDDAARRAGIPADTVGEYWKNETACLIDAVEAATGQAFSRMAEVFLDTTDDCPVAAHRALATLLTDMASAPEMVHVAVVELPRLGRIGREHQARMLELFCEFLLPGFAAMGHAVPDPDIVAVCLGGGIWETVRRLSLERRLHTLPDLLPAISFVCISTFFGAEEAVRVSRTPVHVTPRSAALG